jgi:GT2 family glycosyltransferase
VIIPTRNGLELLRPCLESVFHRTDYKNLEVLIVDNRSDDPNTKQYLESMARHDSVRVLSYDAEFNFAAMNNFAARCARGSVLVLLNNDVEAITPDWLTEMVAHAMRREVGAVGAMLYYPNGRIQHAGVVLGLGWVAGHLYRGVAEASIPPRMRWTMSTRTVTAVSAACLVLRTELYQEVGGLDELDLPIAYNDIDLCLRLQRLGYRIVWSARARLLHHESATRGPDRTTGKARRLRRAEAVMRRRWGAQLTYDPAYNPNLTLIFPDCSPAFPPRVKKPWR